MEPSLQGRGSDVGICKLKEMNGNLCLCSVQGIDLAVPLVALTLLLLKSQRKIKRSEERKIHEERMDVIDER